MSSEITVEGLSVKEMKSPIPVIGTSLPHYTTSAFDLDCFPFPITLQCARVCEMFNSTFIKIVFSFNFPFVSIPNCEVSLNRRNTQDISTVYDNDEITSFRQELTTLVNSKEWSIDDDVIFQVTSLEKDIVLIDICSLDASREKHDTDKHVPPNVEFSAK